MTVLPGVTFPFGIRKIVLVPDEIRINNPCASQLISFANKNVQIYFVGTLII